VDELKARQQLYIGFGNTLTRAFELAVTPLLFGGAGYLLDRWLGILPVLTIIFTLLCLVGLGARMYYGYEADMQAQEANAPWARRHGAP
jgi:F0F1-type ATP synthase assembly protein I